LKYLSSSKQQEKDWAEAQEKHYCAGGEQPKEMSSAGQAFGLFDYDRCHEAQLSALLASPRQHYLGFELRRSIDN
jgi:hypothetical protein